MKVKLSNLMTVNRHYYALFRACFVLVVASLAVVLALICVVVVVYFHSSRPASRQPVFREDIQLPSYYRPKVRTLEPSTEVFAPGERVLRRVVYV